MESLFAPWRYSYLTREPEGGECIFCRARAHPDDHDSLLVYQGAHNFVILNRYPYNNGHLMIVPNDHVSSPSESNAAQRAELIELATTCESALKAIYRPDGINLGMNLGRAAGAGIEKHYHLHMVPRWDGDTNFMAVTAGTRIIPEDLGQTRTRLQTELERRCGRGGEHGA
ncbi:MAG TPA: HIT domain-containing protein [Candidatus Polarisedimenticolia bacterium]|nr:HIT domain-containing protein [Candidatus Polarisedimenticolia bacterium]